MNTSPAPARLLPLAALILLLLLAPALPPTPGQPALCGLPAWLAGTPPAAAQSSWGGGGTPAVQKPAGKEEDSDSEADGEPEGDEPDGGTDDGADDGTDDGADGDTEGAAAEEKPFAPGEFRPWFELDGEIFPAWLLAAATMKSEDEEDPDLLGDRDGYIGVRILAPSDDCTVEVTVSSAKILRPSRFVGNMAKKGTLYFVGPKLDFDYDTLAAITQPFPENVKFQVSVAGGPVVEKLETVTVRAVNDCPFGFTDEDGKWRRAEWTFAAFVNENHPKIHEIMAEAKDDDGNPMVFAGYQREEDGVLAEVESIWEALKARGIRYSSITTPSLPTRSMYSQWVRRPGESLAHAQANCVDGTVILASILRRMGIDVYLVSIPGHMYLAVRLARAGEGGTSLDDLTPIETTMLATGTLEEAIAAGRESFAEHAKGLTAALAAEDSLHRDYAMVSVAEARAMNVLPIREPGVK